MLQIKKLEECHLDAVALISAERFGEMGWAKEEFFERITKSPDFCFVALYEGEVVGFLFGMETEGLRGKEINVLDIAVRQKCSRRGVGSVLLENLMDNASSFQGVWLEVREGNQSAINFYVKHGFKLDYVRKKYYRDGENALVMIRAL